jgi:hypothetical protein
MVHLVLCSHLDTMERDEEVGMVSVIQLESLRKDTGFCYCYCYRGTQAYLYMALHLRFEGKDCMDRFVDERQVLGQA